MDYKVDQWNPSPEDSMRVLDFIHGLVKRAMELNGRSPGEDAPGAMSTLLTIYSSLASKGLQDANCRQYLRGFFTGIYKGAEMTGRNLEDLYDEETCDFIYKLILSESELGSD